MILFLCPILVISYSSFIFYSSQYRSSEMYISNLLYSIKINDISIASIEVPPGETEILVEVTSLNTFETKYKLVYATNPSITVLYANDDNEPAYGMITNTKTSTILITNSSEENVIVSFNIVGGYNNNDFGDILALENYTEVSNDYMKFDYETLAMFLGGVRVQTLDPDGRYKISSYTCNNGETLVWNNTDKSLLVSPIGSPTKCQIYFDLDPYIFEETYPHQASAYPIIIEESGYYILEAWGYGSSNANGAYTKGKVYFEKDDILYIYVGQTSASAEFNRGSTDFRYGGTTINDRIMVAGAGGTYGIGAGGGLTGYAGGCDSCNGNDGIWSWSVSRQGEGGTQLSGGLGAVSTFRWLDTREDSWNTGTNGSFGDAGCGYNGCGYAGGGGWYGGGGGSGNGSIGAYAYGGVVLLI